MFKFNRGDYDREVRFCQHMEIANINIIKQGDIKYDCIHGESVKLNPCPICGKNVEMQHNSMCYFIECCSKSTVARCAQVLKGNIMYTASYAVAMAWNEGIYSDM